MSEGRQPRNAIAVLFVHGMGSQASGRTLFEMGDPVVRWLNRWLHGPTRLDPNALERLDPAAYNGARYEHVTIGTSGEPARALVEVTHDGSSQLWLLAESHWAESFHAAGFIDTLKWGMSSGYFAALHHLATSLERLLHRSWGRWSGVIPVVVGVPLIVAQALLAGIVVQLIAALTVILAAVPLGPVQRAAAAARGWLAESMGDATQISSTDFQYDAMASRLREDIAWALMRSPKVVVVAHSAGAAVALRALAPPRGPQVTTLVTFGAGINKLRAISQWTVVDKIAAGVVLAGGLALPFALWWLVGLLEDVPDAPMDWRVGAGFVAAVIAGLVGLYEVFMHVRRAQSDEFTMKVTADEWLDFYASRDPVPNGPLTRRPTAQLTSREVWNRDSIIRDHTSYWDNKEGFLARLAIHLMDLAGSETTRRDHNAVTRAERRRGWRYRVRRLAGGILLGLTGMVLIALRERLGDVGQAVINAVRDVPFVVGLIGALIVAVLAPLPTALAAFLGSVFESDAMVAVVGALLVIAALFAFRLVLGFVFYAWQGPTRALL